jgi:hypothetical protein
VTGPPSGTVGLGAIDFPLQHVRALVGESMPGRSLASIYWASLLTSHEARRFAANIAKLPGLLKRPSISGYDGPKAHNRPGLWPKSARVIYPRQVPDREQLRAMSFCRDQKLPCGYIFIQF